MRPPPHGSPAPAPPHGAGRRAPRGVGFWVKRLVLGTLTGLAAIVAAAVATYLYFDRGLPSVDELRRYRPPEVTKVYCSDGTLCAEFYRERRTWVQAESLPRHVREAFLAAEDADFYKHPGLDYVGMLRAGLRTLVGGRVTGASTISQQACRNLLLSQERTFARKVREWILTPRMEKALTKDQILNLYLNAIYFGQQRYGIEEAALFYFGKSARELSLGEASVLAGTPQRPDRINPVTNIVAAKARQKYVLTQMWRHGFIPREIAEPELEKPIVLGPRPSARVGLYYAEEVRRTLIARYGEDALLAGGMRVDVAMDPGLQAHADRAVRSGLEDLDRRQGYRGALGEVAPARFATLRPLLARRLTEAGKRRGDAALVADLSALAAQAPPERDEDAPEPERPAPRDDAAQEPTMTADEALARSTSARPLGAGTRLVGWVSAVDDRTGVASIDLIGRTAELQFATARWARPRKDGRIGQAPQKLSDVLRVGQLIQVRIEKVAPSRVEVALDQTPAAQGALVVIEPTRRHVVAMVGGYDFATSSFNRATQARRQPGSSFKPFLYAAAIASQRYTPFSVVNDAPEAIRDPYTGKTWKPQNYEKGGFEGPMTLRMALTRSKNTVSVRLIEALTPQAAIDFARRAGIRSELPENLTLALGTGEVTVLELANAYTTLQSSGKLAEPIQIVRVTDRQGRILEEHQASFDEAFPPAVGYLATSLMRSVVEEGTAVAVRELGRPAAGKTGTAQEFRDAWFAGYTTELVAAAWVGFDGHEPLGQGETGGRAALPLWLNFMKAAHESLPLRDFEPPDGVSLVRVDPATGLLAGPSVPGRLEPFLEGTEPTTEAPAPGQVDPGQFFLDEGRNRQGGL